MLGKIFKYEFLLQAYIFYYYYYYYCYYYYYYVLLWHIYVIYDRFLLRTFEMVLVIFFCISFKILLLSSSI